MLDTGALEHLLEVFGPEFALEIRTAVVNEFARRHVKAVVSDEVKNHVEGLTKKAILEELNAQTTNNPSIINHGLYERIKRNIKDAFAAMVRQEVMTLQPTIKEQVNDIVQREVHSILYTTKQQLYTTTEKEVAAEVRRRVADALKVMQ
jgi:hypothetical protein